MTDLTIAHLLSKFQISGQIISALPFGSGHINDTYRITTNSGNTYLLQRINHFVFKDVPGLMNNLVLVTQHLRKKLLAITASNPDKQVLTLIKTNTGAYYIKDDEGNYWRVFNFLNDTRSYDQVSTEKQAYEGGKAFGRFQSLLADLDPALMVETIPGFLNIEYRLQNLDKAIAADSVKRLPEVSAEIAFINQRRTQMGRILKMGREGELPLRITHNDTKFNNVLLDENDHAQCVIDLDTVMPGYLAYDFGDAIRTIINNSPEDEADIDNISLNIPLFSAYVKGYLQQTVGLLTETEVHSLIEGVLLLPYMQFVRFLTDYLEGDIYYKIYSPQHNLQRARAQFQLLKKLEEAKTTLNDIIISTYKNEIQ
ncbi:phosphotransferase enzyme family protein [Mucilaginibacter sp.]|uniref:phosphotransferase enzyme family protein n=1 Tax=Mucilaginibacter sp. TaxID=1882438 RepID=UPI003D109781